MNSDFFDLLPTPYPYDLEERLNNNFRLNYDLQDEIDLIYPNQKQKKKKLNILILGCGCNEAVYHAYRNPKLAFHAVDYSKVAIDKTKEQIKQFKLKNIDVEKKDISDITNGSYDVIFTMDVLSYVESPLKILKQIQKLLSKDGKVLLSLPSYYHYNQVHYVRKTLLKLGYSYSNSDEVDAAFSLVRKLPELHPSRIALINFTRKEINLENLIDKNDFIHDYLVPRFNIYTLDDLFELLDDAKLYFQSWYDNALYYSSSTLSNSLFTNDKDKNIQNLSSLDLKDQWDFTNRLRGPYRNHYKHRLCLSKNKNDEFIEEKLIKDDNSLVFMRPYASLSNNPDLGGRFFIKSNFTKSLTDIEVNLLDNLSEPLSISKLVEKNKDLYDEKEIKDNLKNLQEYSAISFLTN